MSALDLTIGYPAHAVATARRWSNKHGVRFTDWTAPCGATGTAAGLSPFGRAGAARKAELCPKCWPAGVATHQRPPVDADVDLRRSE